MAWHLLWKLTKQSVAHVTLAGKWWVGFTLTFRIILIASVGYTASRDEQVRFTCNTRQPECVEACYNEFAPISHIVFDAFQILLTAMPTVVFVLYATRIPAKPEGDDVKKETPFLDENDKKAEAESKNRDDEKLEGKKPNESDVSGKYLKSDDGASMVQDEPKDKDILKGRDAISATRPLHKFNEHILQVCREYTVRKVKRKIIRLYAIILLLRTGVEVTFVYMRYYLYQWSAPESYMLYLDPCPYIVKCFVSQPKEKTIFYFMFIVGIICILLNILEIKYFGYKKLKRTCFPVESRHFVLSSAIEEMSSITEKRIAMAHPNHISPGFDILDEDPPIANFQNLDSHQFESGWSASQSQNQT